MCVFSVSLYMYLYCIIAFWISLNKELMKNESGSIKAFHSNKCLLSHSLAEGGKTIKIEPIAH